MKAVRTPATQKIALESVYLRAVSRGTSAAGRCDLDHNLDYRAPKSAFDKFVQGLRIDLHFIVVRATSACK